MRAVRVYKFGGPKVLRLESGISCPNLLPWEVLIRVIYSGVNPIETYIREGQHSKLPSLPYTPGSDASGFIEALGSRVASGGSDLQVGDRVFVTGNNSGSYAEYLVSECTYVFKLDIKLTLAQGASLGLPYFTAYKAIMMGAKLRPGEKVLIHGASGAVGTAAVQIARGIGATVVGTAGTKAGMDVVSYCGAHNVFNHNHRSYQKKILSIIGEEGFDVIIEHLANVNLGHDLGLMGPNARIIVVGCRGPVDINPRSIMLLESSIQGICLGTSSPSEWREIGAAIVGGVESGSLNPIINRVYSMEEVQSVHHDIVHMKGAKGKLVLKVAHDEEVRVKARIRDIDDKDLNRGLH